MDGFSDDKRTRERVQRWRERRGRFFQNLHFRFPVVTDCSYEKRPKKRQFSNISNEKLLRISQWRRFA